MPNLADILVSIRELSFDSAVTPTLYIRAIADTLTPRKLSISSTALTVKDSDDNIVTDILFASVPTLQGVMNALMNDTQKYQLANSSSFIGSEPSTSLQIITDKEISDTVVALYRSYFFSEQYIINEVLYEYFIGPWCYSASVIPDDYAERKTFFETEISENLKTPYDRHMAIWCAYHVLDRRRVYETAAIHLDATSFFNSDEDIGLVHRTENSANISISIGDVFSMSLGPETEDITENIHLAGVDNVLGDKNSFWYRNQLYLRGRIEYLFSDYSLRKNQAIQTHMSLIKDTNGYAYYDNYPWTLSPISREILSN